MFFVVKLDPKRLNVTLFAGTRRLNVLLVAGPKPDRYKNRETNEQNMKKNFSRNAFADVVEILLVSYLLVGMLARYCSAHLVEAVQLADCKSPTTSYLAAYRGYLAAVAATSCLTTNRRLVLSWLGIAVRLVVAVNWLTISRLLVLSWLGVAVITGVHVNG